MDAAFCLADGINTVRIFIIGATGFVGGAVARHLSHEGHHVTGLARSALAAVTVTTQGITRAR